MVSDRVRLERVIAMRDQIGPTILKIFGVEAELPLVEFMKGLPGTIAFTYTEKEGEPSIAVDPKYDEQYDTLSSIPWGIAEEVSHFCHYTLNRDFFMRIIDLSKDKNLPNNNLFFELDNLSEFIARMGGLASGCMPPDFGMVMDAWYTLVRSSGAKSKEEFERAAEKDPEYAKKVGLASSRVWGTGLADYFHGSNGIRTNIPRYRKILRELTQCDGFDEAADVFEIYMPGSKEAKEVRDLSKLVFSD